MMSAVGGQRSESWNPGTLEHWIRWQITQSPNHPITQSPNHPITQSPSHLITLITLLRTNTQKPIPNNQYPITNTQYPTTNRLKALFPSANKRSAKAYKNILGLFSLKGING